MPTTKPFTHTPRAPWSPDDAAHDIETHPAAALMAATREAAEVPA